MSPKLVQSLAKEFVVAVESGGLAARSHHPLARLARLDSVGVVHSLARHLAVLLGLFAHFFVLIDIEFHQVDVAFDAVFVLVRLIVEQILILC